MVYGGERQFPRADAEGRPETGPSSVDRGKTGSRHHVIADGHGIPLALSLTGGNRNDVTQLMPLLRGIPPVRAFPSTVVAAASRYWSLFPPPEIPKVAGSRLMWSDVGR